MNCFLSLFFKALFPLLLSFATLGSCDVTSSDLRGAFNFKSTKGRFSFCTGNLLLESSGLVMTVFQIGKTNPCAMSLPHQIRLEQNLPKLYGRSMYKTHVVFTCGSRNNLTVSIFRPTKTVRITNRAGLNSTTKKGFLYVHLHDRYRSCLWWRNGNIQLEDADASSGAAPSPTTSNESNGNGKLNTKEAAPSREDADASSAAPSTTSSNKSNGNGKLEPKEVAPSRQGEVNNSTGRSANNNREGGYSNLWEWLGPVLGAVATIVAAVLTVYLSRDFLCQIIVRGKSTSEDNLPMPVTPRT